MTTHKHLKLINLHLWVLYGTIAKVVMECSHNMRVISEDVESLDSVAELYFETRDYDGDEEACDSPYDDSSSESGDEPNEDEDFTDGSEMDMTEKAKVDTFFANTCNCKFGEDEKACSRSLSLDDFFDSRNNCHELSSTERDLIILGAIQSSLNCNEVSVSGRSHKHRKQPRMAFYYHGKRICKKTFLFLHCLNKNRFCSLVKHYRKNRLTLRVHGNKKRLPSSAFSSETIERVVKFILNVAEEQALLLPGRVPGFKRTDVRLLPSVLTKHSLWKTYTEISASQGQLHIGYSKFCDIWNQLCPFVLIMRPATDLCWTCQKNNNLIQKSANLPEIQKVEAVKAQEEHLRLTAGERGCNVAGNLRKAFASTCEKSISASGVNHVLIMELFITHMIMRSSCITRRIRVSQGPFILKLPGNVVSSEYVAKQFQGRLTLLSTKTC